MVAWIVLIAGIVVPLVHGHAPPKAVCKMAAPGGLSKLNDVMNALNNNVGRKLNVVKRFNLGNLDLKCSVRSPDVDPYSKCGTQLIPINVRRAGGLANIQEAGIENLIDEVNLEATVDFDAKRIANARVSVDLPNTLKYVTSGKGGIFRTGKIDLVDTLRRIDFVYKHADMIAHAGYNMRNNETTIEVLKRLEDLYVLHGKYVHVTPKLELILDRGISPKTNFCLGIERGGDSITPVIYPLQKRFEVMAEKTITDGIKAGVYWSMDNRVFVNLSLSFPWGKSGWQTLAFRFVFPEILRSHVHMLNELYIS
ncbi:hypothetical protein BaOVIS_011780 [Babesia ovis]|uniref:Uncharacterized protein n=1 Tax=Babesia ovis TaxID=5869 RepID=A0A9W5WUE1_BABOV|nr:hypothetical protein BaOVIS_011780 [Babesia ovis]